MPLIQKKVFFLFHLLTKECVPADCLKEPGVKSLSEAGTVLGSYGILFAAEPPDLYRTSKLLSA